MRSLSPRRRGHRSRLHPRFSGCLVLVVVVLTIQLVVLTAVVFVSSSRSAEDLRIRRAGAHRSVGEISAHVDGALTRTGEAREDPPARCCETMCPSGAHVCDTGVCEINAHRNPVNL